MLSGTDAIHIATVVDDCVDQLAILGRILPVNLDGRGNATQIVQDEIDQIMECQRELEEQYENAQLKKAEMKNIIGGKQLLPQIDRSIRKIGGDLTNSTHAVSRNMKQSPLTDDNLVKIQQDRAFVQQVLTDTLHELVDKRSFQTLIDAVQKEKDKKAHLQNIIQKEADGRKKIKQLTKAIQECKKSKEAEIKQRNEMIAHLKDQLQEMKAKTQMESKYVKKCTEVSVAQTQKKCGQTERKLKENISQLKQQIDEETRVNAEVDSFLRTHLTQLEKALEYWMEKYDKDVDAKQRELDALKLAKARDLERLQELSKQYKEYEQVVNEHRTYKEKLRRKEEKDVIELKASIKIQSWWKGMMVRAGLGAFAKKKKKKGKKGKGKKGKK